MRNRWLEAALYAAPGVLLGISGIAHPMHLNPSTAHRWFALHLVGLFIVPLIGLAVALLMHGRRDVLAVIAVIGAYAFSTLYTALDVISGIGNGYVTDHLGAGAVPRPAALGQAFHIGNMLGNVGAWGLFVAAALVGADAVRRQGVSAVLPALLLLVGAFFVRNQHIFWPWGVLSCVAIGLGTGGLAWVNRRSTSLA